MSNIEIHKYEIMKVIIKISLDGLNQNRIRVSVAQNNSDNTPS